MADAAVAGRIGAGVDVAGPREGAGLAVGVDAVEEIVAEGPADQVASLYKGMDLIKNY